MVETNRKLWKFYWMLAIIILVGVLAYYFRQNIFSIWTVSPYAVGSSQEMNLGVEARNNKDCTGAIVHFTNSLKQGTQLSKEDRARVWFWKGLCEYELGFKPQASYSLSMVKKTDPNNTSADTYLPLQ